MKKYFIIVLLFSVVALVMLPTVRDFIKNQFLPSASIETKQNVSEEDDLLILKGINTPNTTLKALRKKGLFLNFWGTWCPPCRKEWPSIEALYHLKKNKINFALIAMKDEEVAVRKFLTENKFTAPVYFAESPITENLLPKSFPTTFLIDKNGKIRLKEESYKNWIEPSAIELVENEIEK